MGLFNLFRGNKMSSKTKKNQVLYEYDGYDHLPDDYDILEEMFDYYNDLYKKNDYKGYDEERFMIAKKFKEAGDKQVPYNPINRGRFVYTLYFGTTDETVAYYFDEFIEKSRQTVIPASILKQRRNKNIIIDEHLYQASFSSFLEHRFEFHDKENLSDEEKEDNALVEYYENHLGQLVDVIFELIDKQKQGDMLLYTGYFMYRDLYKFFVEAEHRFSKKVWERTHDYNQHCSYYYDGFLLFKLDHCKKSYDIIQRRNQIAMKNMPTCDKKTLYLMSQNYVPSQNVMNIINQYSHKYNPNLNDYEIKNIVSQIIDLSKGVCFVTAQRNKIASLFCLFALKCDDEDIAKKICIYLENIEQNGINTSLDEINHVPNKIKEIEMRKRELHAKNNNLPTFSITPSEIKFMGVKSSNIKYYDMPDGRHLIVTDVFTCLDFFKEGDILESIQSGERFELASMHYKPSLLFEDIGEDVEEDFDDSDVQLLEVQILCKNKHHFDKTETLAKMN